ncbi:TPA: hypothetical protein ACF2DW_001843 [Clostridium perfringens]
MRSEYITFADLTKVYNEIYSEYTHQSTISRSCRKMVNIFDKKFFEFLEEKKKYKEILFLSEAIKPINEGKTKFDYKTYCLMLVSLINRGYSNDSLINTARKRRKHIEEYKYIDFFDEIDRIFQKIISISLNNFKILKRAKIQDDKLKEKKKKEFKVNIISGIKTVIRIYDLLDEYYRYELQEKIHILLSKINLMSYESKLNLINILEKEIEKEIIRTNERKIDESNEGEVIQKKLDIIENEIAMKSVMSKRELKKIQNKDGSFFANLERSNYENN